MGGVPRGRGEGGNLLRAHRFKLRNPRTALYFFTTSLQREEEIWRLLQKECFLQRWAHLRKQADAQSGRCGRCFASSLFFCHSWSDCSWLCLHCFLRRFHKGHLASPLVNANSVWTNGVKRSEAEWENTLFATFLGRSVYWNKKNVESGSGTKYGWSERQLTNSIWNSELDSELDSKPILMGDTQNHSVWLRPNNTLRYKYLIRKR